MIKLLVDKLPRIIKVRKKLEERLKVKITNRGREIFIDGDSDKEFIGEKIVLALDMGFAYSEAILILEQDLTLEIMNIKDYTKRHDLERIRGRIIGRDGKTLKTLASLTQCYFELKDNNVAIICDAENLQNARQAIISLIQGSKTSNVYRGLEKNRPQPIYDLGLKE